MAANLPELRRPTILQGDLGDLPGLLAALDPALHAGPGEGHSTLHFDVIIGRNALTSQPDKTTPLRTLAELLAPGGRLVLAEAVPRHTQRLYRLVELASLPPDLAQRLVAAEEAIYQDSGDPLVNWDERDLQNACTAAGLDASINLELEPVELRISAVQLDQWFDPRAGGRPSYGQRLASHLSPDEIALVASLFRRKLSDQVVIWRSPLALVAARLGSG